MMKINRLFISIILVFTYINAKTFYVDEPVLNTKVFVQTYGDKNKEVIVLVHGLGHEASSIWENTIERFKNDYYVITFDLPGFGKSSRVNRELTPTNYALFINYISNLYVKKPFYLIGHSMGGAISLKYTSMFPKDVKKLLLIDAAGILHRDTYSNFLITAGIDNFFKIKSIEPLNKISSIFSQITTGIQDYIPSDLSLVIKTEYIRQMLFKNNTTAIAAIGLVMEDYSNVVYSINTPTEILWGENDDIAPVRTGYALNKILKDSKINVIPNSGHIPIIDSKDIYLKYVDNFLKNKNIKRAQKDSSFNTKYLLVKNQNNVVINGKYKSLKIIDSNNIKIDSSNIEELIIINSDVKILNSTIKSKNIAIDVKNSNLEVTACDIDGFYAIQSENTRLDLAGSTLNSIENSIKNKNINNKDILILSLTTINSKFYKNRVFHEKMEIDSNNRI